jgi:hypothetical protein
MKRVFENEDGTLMPSNKFDLFQKLIILFT